MIKKRSRNNIFINAFFLVTGLSIGVVFIWPGILKIENRQCFVSLIKDGRDGKVSLGTILSLEPNQLLKINSAKTKYKKILLIGDNCFRD